MTFTAYIQRQKSLIRSRRESGGAVAFTYARRTREEIIPNYDTESLIDELAGMKGLNTAERTEYSKIFSHG